MKYSSIFLKNVNARNISTSIKEESYINGTIKKPQKSNNHSSIFFYTQYQSRKYQVCFEKIVIKIVKRYIIIINTILYI